MSTLRTNLCGITHVNRHLDKSNSLDSQDPQSVVRQAQNDQQLIELWLHGRPSKTQKAYRRDIAKAREAFHKPLQKITLGDLQAYSDYLQDEELAPASIRRYLATIKSLFKFAHEIGYIPFDTAKPLRLPPLKDNLSHRILTEDEIHLLIEADRTPRNRMIVKLFYISGIRVSELASLKWKDIIKREDGFQLTIYGKGDKTNNILLPESLWVELESLRNGASDESPIFKSRKKGHLDPGQIQRIIRNITNKAGLSKRVSPHWFRHSHASHALDRGCPIHLVQKQLNHSSISTTGRYLHARPTESSSTYLNL